MCTVLLWYAVYILQHNCDVALMITLHIYSIIISYCLFIILCIRSLWLVYYLFQVCTLSHLTSGASCRLGGKESICQSRRHEFYLLVQEDPLCCWAAKPALHNKRSQSKWEAGAPQLESSHCSPQLEISPGTDKRPSAARIKIKPPPSPLASPIPWSPPFALRFFLV